MRTRKHAFFSRLGHLCSLSIQGVMFNLATGCISGLFYQQFRFPLTHRCSGSKANGLSSTYIKQLYVSHNSQTHVTNEIFKALKQRTGKNISKSRHIWHYNNTRSLALQWSIGADSKEPEIYRYCTPYRTAVIWHHRLSGFSRNWKRRRNVKNFHPMPKLKSIRKCSSWL